MNVNIIDALISVVAVAVLVPNMGINGYLLTIYITEIINAACSVCRLLRISGYRPAPFRLLFLPLLSVVGATALSSVLFSHCMPYFFGVGTSLAFHIFTVAMIYFAFLFFSGGFGQKDLIWLLSILGFGKRRREIKNGIFARKISSTCKK